MDQVPLPFVVEQEWTFTSYDDAHVHIHCCGADGLTKRQYTMHILSMLEMDKMVFAISNSLQEASISQVEKAGWHPLD
eukprot:scaffold76063_cov47-Attheya_sp.AAC.1